MLIKDVLDRSIVFLKNKGLPTPRLDVELLISHVLKTDRMGLYLKYDKPLLTTEIESCRQMIIERGKGAPVAYLTGVKGFFRNEFKVNKNVLVPRPETELLVECVVSWIKEKKINTPSMLELGVGSGCIIISVISELIGASIIPESAKAIDISEEALNVARENSASILKENSNLIEFIQADASKYLTSEKFDTIFSNPPYISENDLQIEKAVRDYEPHKALFAKNDGYQYIFDWMKFGCNNLKPGGLIIFEIGCSQGEKVAEYFKNSNCFKDIEIIKDYAGLSRFIKAVKNG